MAPKGDEFLREKLQAVEAENKRLRAFIKDAYMAGCDGNENEIGLMLGDMLEELGYQFGDEGRLIDDEDDS